MKAEPVNYLAIEIRMISEKLGVDLAEMSKRFREAEEEMQRFNKMMGLR